MLHSDFRGFPRIFRLLLYPRLNFRVKFKLYHNLLILIYSLSSVKKKRVRLIFFPQAAALKMTDQHKYHETTPMACALYFKAEAI